MNEKQGLALVKSHTRGWKLVAAFALLGVLLTQFNNCGGYQGSAATDDASLDAVTCTTNNCIVPDQSIMAVTPHLASSGDEGITAALSEFNIGGDCNEGGYPYNTIRWELVLNGAVVRTSDMPVAGGAPANSKCINGRFLIYVNLAALTSGDTVNRTGLANGSTRSGYDLYIYLYGQSTVNAPLDKTIMAQGHVPLAVF